MQKTQRSAARLLAGGFAIMILAGTFFLMLPAATRAGDGTSFIDALFTATSASCVTGLIVVDTWTHYNLFGQIVMLTLIQIGGLGFMIVAMEFAFASGKRVGVRTRAMISESVGASQIGGMVRLVKRALIGTAVIEGMGALLLATRFIPEFGLARGIWYSVFHAISAFCNAGFDLMGIKKPYSSLTAFAGDPVVSLTICGLILIGGIGFIVWNDMAENKFRWRNLSLHSRTALASTGIITAASAFLFWLFENSNTMAGDGPLEKFLKAVFMSVTPRTAGYNTVEIASMTQVALILTMFLMFVGASPGGTGGGIKTTTFVILLSVVHASAKGRGEAEIGRFRIGDDVIKRACGIVSLYLLETLFGAMILCSQGVPFLNSLFECFSAIGTVGLTTGITSTLGNLSKITLICLMYLGRVGSFSVFVALSSPGRTRKLREPVGELVV